MDAAPSHEVVTTFSLLFRLDSTQGTKESENVCVKSGNEPFSFLVQISLVFHIHDNHSNDTEKDGHGSDDDDDDDHGCSDDGGGGHGDGYDGAAHGDEDGDDDNGGGDYGWWW